MAVFFSFFITEILCRVISRDNILHKLSRLLKKSTSGFFLLRWFNFFVVYVIIYIIVF